MVPTQDLQFVTLLRTVLLDRFSPHQPDINHELLSKEGDTLLWQH